MILNMDILVWETGPTPVLAPLRRTCRAESSKPGGPAISAVLVIQLDARASFGDAAAPLPD